LATSLNFKVKNGLDVGSTLTFNGNLGVGSSPSYGTSGQVLTSQGAGNAPIWSTVSGGGGSYTLPTATSTALGGIELFSDTAQTVAANAVTTTASRTYGLQLNASLQGVINVPWTDTNTFPTTWTWTGGTTAGPTASITGTSSTISVAAIPAASATTSGVLTTTTQTIAGDKTFTGGTLLGSDSNTTSMFVPGVTSSGTYIRYNGASRLGVTPGGLIAASGVYGNVLSTSFRAVYVTSSTAPDTLGYVASSRSMKKAIEPLSYTAEQILSIEPVEYRYKPEPDTNPKHAGFIVEDLEDAGLHAYISYGEDGVTPETINYEFYVSALQKVVRHQAGQISDLEARLTALENK
jgi:hypothetical protein